MGNVWSRPEARQSVELNEIQQENPDVSDDEDTGTGLPPEFYQVDDAGGDVYDNYLTTDLNPWQNLSFCRPGYSSTFNVRNQPIGSFNTEAELKPKIPGFRKKNCLKIVVLGSSGSGKTTIICRMIGQALPEKLKKTECMWVYTCKIEELPNADLMERLSVNSKKSNSSDGMRSFTHLQFYELSVEAWDYPPFGRDFFKKMALIIVVFDTNSIESFEHAKRLALEFKWYEELYRGRKRRAPILFLANKLDLLIGPVIEKDHPTVMDFANRFSTQCKWISALNEINMNEIYAVFDAFVIELLLLDSRRFSDVEIGPGIGLDFDKSLSQIQKSKIFKPKQFCPKLRFETEPEPGKKRPYRLIHICDEQGITVDSIEEPDIEIGSQSELRKRCRCCILI